MAIGIVLTPQAMLLALTMIDNLISGVFSKVAQMTPEEVSAGIIVEEEKKKANMDELARH